MDLKTAYNSFVKYTGNIKQAVASGQAEYSALRMGQNAVGLSLKDAGISKLSFGIGAVTTALSIGMAAVNAYNEHWENLRQSADEAGQAFESTASDIDSYKQKISELKTSLASGTLSQQEQYDAKTQLLSIQDEIIEKYGQEASALDILSQSSSTYADNLDRITAEEAKRNLRQNEQAYEEAADKVGSENLFEYDLGYDTGGYTGTSEMIAAIQKVASEYDNISVAETAIGRSTLQVTGDAFEAQEALEALYNEFEKSGNGRSEFSVVKDRMSDTLADVEDLIADFGDRYKESLVEEITADDVARPIKAQIENYSKQLDEALASEDYDTASGIINSLQSIDLSEIDSDPIRKYLQEMIEDACSDEYTALVKLNTEFADGSDSRNNFLKYLGTFTNSVGVVDASTLLEMDNASDLSHYSAEYVQAFQMMQIIAGAYGKTVSEMVEYLSSVGAVQTNVATSTEELTSILSESETVVSGLSDAYSTLATAMQEMQGGGLKQSTALSLMKELTEAGEDYSNYLTVENGKIKLNTAAYLKYANAANEAALKKAEDRKAELEAIMEQNKPVNTAPTNIYSDAVNEYNQINKEIEFYKVLIGDVKNSTEEFFSIFESGKSKMSSISDIFEAMQTGGATQSEALDWIKDMPELANYYDASSNSFTNMEEALVGIVDSDVNRYIDSLNEYLRANPDLSDAAKSSILALGEAYKDLATQTVSAGDAGAVLNKNVSKSQKPFKRLKTQLKNLWNSDAFSDARSDMVNLAKSTGITASDITDLAKDNIYLQAMLKESGVSASYLAEIFERLSTSGDSALDGVTDDAIRVNAVLSEMEEPLAKVNAAYEKYQATLGSWEYDDTFDNYQEAYKNLGEMFDNGEYGADFYRTIDYLYGEGHGADGVKSLYEQYKKLGQVFSEDDNGLGFIEKLYDSQKALGGDWVKLDSNGNYLWNIEPDDFAGIAKGLNMTEDEVASCVEALGMFGDFTEYDPTKLVDTFKDLNMAITDTEGNAVLSEDAIRSMLESLGKEPWQIDQIIAKLKEADGIKIYDESDADSVQSLISDLEEVGKLKIDGSAIGLDDLTSALRSIGMSDEGIQTMMQTLSGMGYYFTDTAGNALELSDALDRIDSTSLENLTSDAEAAQKALNDLLGRNTFNIDFNSDNIDGLTDDIEYLESVKRKLTQDDGQTPLAGMESEVQNLNTMLYALLAKKDSLQQPFIMSVDTSGFEGKVYQLISDLQNLEALTQEKTRLISIGADTSNVQSQIDTTIANINNADPEIKASFGIDEAATDSEIFAAIGRIKSEVELEKIMLDAGVDQEEVNAFLGTEHTAEGKVVFYVNSKYVDAYKPPKKYGRVEYSVNATMDGVSLSAWTPPTKYGKIEYTGSQSTRRSYIGYEARSVVNGTAHASGNWGLKRGEKGALLGELGTEIVVDPNSGMWYTVGDNGAQFSDLPKGAIVFNHVQTEALLKNGKVTGRGRAFASGTVSRKNPINGEYYISSYSGSNSSSGKSNTGSGSSGSDSAEEYLELLDWIEIAIDRIERKISSLDTTAQSAFRNIGKRTSAIADEMANISTEMSYQQTAYDAYINAADAVELSDSYKELVRNGKILLEEITDEDLNNRITEYRDLYEKALDARDAIADLGENLSQLYQDRFDVVSTQLDNVINGIDARSSLLEEYVSQIENSGHTVNSKYYELMIEAQRDKLNSLVQGKTNLINQLNESLKSGTIEEYSEAWYEMKSKIDETSQSIVEINGEIQDLNQQIRQLKWDEFDDARDSVSQLNDEAEFYIDVLSRGDSLFDDKGNIGSAGLATMGLHIQEYETYLEQAKSYADEIKNIEDQLADDPYNKDLIERKQELIEAQRESAKAALDEKDALVDLVKQGIDLQLSSLSDLIDKYKDSLDAAKDAYEYQKKIKDQTEEIASIEKQLNAYSGDDSEETRATIQKLKNDLKDAKDDLKDSQYDQYVSDQKDLLDDLYDSYEETLNKRLDDIDALVSECTDAVNASGQNIADAIKDAASSTGTALSNWMELIWKTDYNKGVNDRVDRVTDAIDKGISDRYSNGSESGIIEQMKQNSLLHWTANDSEREALHSQNKILAQELSALTGGTVYSKGGSWYDKNGNLLYKLDRSDVIHSIVDKMQQNSKDYFSASAEEKQALSAENLELGKRLGKYTGKNVYRGSDGTWYVDGNKLYDIYGSKGSITNKRFAGLNSANIPSNPAMFVSDSIKNATVGAGYRSLSSITTTNNNEYAITFNLPNVKSYEEFMNSITSDAKFERYLQTVTVDMMAGKSATRKNSIKW